MSGPTRRAFLAGVAGAAAIPVIRPRRRPNILLLMTDQHRFDFLGCVNRAVHTPNIDQLAASGVRFTNAYSCTPSCTPARAALLTGLGPWRNGMLGYGRLADRYPREMPAMLGEAGYRTMAIGKLHYAPQRNLHGFQEALLDESGRVESPGFTSDYRAWFARVAPGRDPDATGIGWNDYAARPYALPEELHPTRWTGDRAVEWLQSYRDEAPYFLKVSFARPHSPYDAPERLWKRYEGVELPGPRVGDWADRYACRGQKLPADTWRGDLGHEVVRRARQGYAANITFIDEQVGRILDALRASGRMANTLVLFTADHGDMLGDHNLWRKTYAYEGSAHIPMVCRWPDGVAAPHGRLADCPVELRDVMPSFLSAAGVHFERDWFDGRDLLGAVRGAGRRRWIDLEHAECYTPYEGWNGLADGKRKYVRFSQTGTEQYFDLEKDPAELHDLSGDPAHAREVGVWRRRLQEHLRPRGKPFVDDNGKLATRTRPVIYSPNYPR